MFFKANLQQAAVVKEALGIYERCTGQLLSPAKCSLLFGKHCPEQMKEAIKSVLQVQQNTFKDKYLGLPTPSGRMKAGKYQSLMDRLMKRLSDWAEKFLSMGGKEVLIKSVIQALPTYVMSVFKLPSGFCEDYMKMIRKFWWGEEKNRRKTHWTSWQQLIKPKSKGGIGFKDLKIFNQALLARQAWRLIQLLDSLCAKLMKAWYFPNGHLIDTVFPTDSSEVWRGICHGLELLKKGIIWRIGKGDQLHIWRDNWIPRDHQLRVTGKRTRTRLKWVADLVSPNNQEWDEGLIRQIFYPPYVDEILKIKLPESPTDDFLAWHPERLGVFTVRSAYKLGLAEEHRANEAGACSSNGNGDRVLWKNIWSAQVPQKVCIFAWRLAVERLPTQHNKQKRNIVPSARCEVCGAPREDGFHATVVCTKAKALRDELRAFWPIPPEDKFVRQGPDWLLLLLDTLDMRNKAQMLLMLWRAWHLRNNSVHDTGTLTISGSIRFLQSYVQLLFPIRQKEDPKGKCAAQVPGRLNQNPGVTKADCLQIWEPPPEGWAKINVDGAFSMTDNTGGIGVIARDSEGKALLSSWKYLHRCADAEQVEILACYEGMKLAAEWIRKPIILESDCITVIGRMTAEDEERSRWTFLIRSAKAVMRSLQEVRIQHRKRV